MTRLKDWRMWAGLILSIIPMVAAFFGGLSAETVAEISIVCTVIAQKLGINMPSKRELEEHKDDLK